MRLMIILHWIFYHIKGIVRAIIIFDHGFKFGIVFIVSDHPAHEKLIARKKLFTIE